MGKLVRKEGLDIDKYIERDEHSGFPQPAFKEI